MSIDHASGLSRRTFVKSLALAAAVPRLAWTGSATDAGTGVTRMFALADIDLGEGVFAHSHALNRRYLAALEVDRLVAPYRIEAALAPRAPKYPNWESMGLEGHTAGHYLSALAQEAAQGDDEMRRRLDYMVMELAACQQANGGGYVGAVPNGRALWNSVAAGTIDAGSFSLGHAWVPFYNLHKMFAGLRDAWLHAGNRQARGMLIAFADWADRLVAGLDEQRMQALLATEHGGMNEVLADVYAITGDRRYLALARRFSHRALLEPLQRREDALDGLHANTQIPKVIGFARIGELDNDQAWIDAAAFFWETVTRRRSIAFGGNSVREHFNPVGDFSSMVGSPEGPETCNSYNMLRLSTLLYRLDPQARYADFYERTLFNHILSSQHPQHGGLVYFTPIRPRHYRVYSQPQECFWCCVGTGIENHGRHGAFAYAHDAHSLTVNLYMASRVQWRERGLVLRQDTHFPDEESSRLSLQLHKPQRFRLRLRHPHWLQGPFEVRVNGKPWPLQSTPSAYASIEREWADGDLIEIDLPMHTRAEGLPDGSDYVALMHGPIVLAARTGTEDLDGLIADDGRGSHVAPGPLLPLDRAPILVGDRDTLVAQVRPVPGRPLTFDAGGLIRPAAYETLRLEPLFRVHDARYVVYWRTATASAYPALVRRIEADERQRQALEARTLLDQVAPGEQQPEVEHEYQGVDSNTGVRLGRHWRDTGRWISYRLKARDGTDPSMAAELLLAFHGGDHNEGFDLLVDGRGLETIRLQGDANDTFVERRIALPKDLARAAVRQGITIKLVALAGRRTSGLFDLRLLRRNEDHAHRVAPPNDQDGLGCRRGRAPTCPPAPATSAPHTGMKKRTNQTSPWRIFRMLHLVRRALLAVTLFGFIAAAPAYAHETLKLEAPKPLLAPTPPMGWNSWNKFACNINEALVRKQADAMVASGMKDAGYQYVVIDDCWQKSRDADGNIVADPERFPSGIKALADYVHSKGLKFGLYSDAGALTCGGRPGSAGHEFQDARQYAKWGVDYLKYDWCYTGPRNAEAAYTIMAKALRASGRDIVLSICEWGTNQPERWGPTVGHLWRTTGDIYDAWEGKKDWSHGMTNILDMQVERWRHAAPNAWNDPDMLEVGNGGMTTTEYESHFSLWAMLAAPLIAGNDLSTMDADTRRILTNTDVIAVDQDPLGQQARRIWKQGDLEIWARPLQGGKHAVVLFNRGKAPSDMKVGWDQLELPAGQKADVKDLWSKKVSKNVRGSYSGTVAPHGVIMLRITPVQ